MVNVRAYAFVDGTPCEVIASGTLICMFGQNGRITIDKAQYDFVFVENDSGKSSASMVSQDNKAVVTFENIGQSLQSSIRMTVGDLDGFRIYLDAFIAQTNGIRGTSRVMHYSFVKSREASDVRT